MISDILRLCVDESVFVSIAKGSDVVTKSLITGDDSSLFVLWECHEVYISVVLEVFFNLLVDISDSLLVLVLEGMFEVRADVLWCALALECVPTLNVLCACVTAGPLDSVPKELMSVLSWVIEE